MVSSKIVLSGTDPSTIVIVAMGSAISTAGFDGVPSWMVNVSLPSATPSPRMSKEMFCVSPAVPVNVRVPDGGR